MWARTVHSLRDKFVITIKTNLSIAWLAINNLEWLQQAIPGWLPRAQRWAGNNFQMGFLDKQMTISQKAAHNSYLSSSYRPPFE